MTPQEALHQCVEAMKEVDFADCGKDDARWHKLNAAQLAAEAVLKAKPSAAETVARFWQAVEGSSKPIEQEPVCYCVPNDKGNPLFGKGWMFSPVPQLKAQMPLYAAPVASQPAAAAVPEGHRIVPNRPTKEMQSVWDTAPFTDFSDEEFRMASDKMLAAAPQPEAGSAVPSGDVERMTDDEIIAHYLNFDTWPERKAVGAILLKFARSIESSITATKE